MSQLKVSYDELRREIGRHLGYGRTPSSWDAEQTQDVADILKAGQWNFYWPPVGEGGVSHLWSFLSVSSQIELTNGQDVYALPDDFVRLQSGFTLGVNGNEWRLSVESEEAVRAMQSKTHLNGVPRYVAIRARQDQMNEGYELLFYPRPDRTIVVDYRYERYPPAIEAGNPYHLGPPVHSKLLVSACLMEADRKLNAEVVSPEGGVHAQRFFRELAASIALDRQVLGVA